MDCLFCKIINNEIPSYTIYEDKNVKCFLDINPKSNGDTLIVPKKHFKDLTDIDLDTLSIINETSKKIYDLLTEKLNPSGIQLIQNNGNIQEIKHYHLHVTPYYGRNKKMSVEEVYKLLTK